MCDISKESLAAHIQPGTVDVCTMIFVLSAIDPTAMVKVSTVWDPNHPFLQPALTQRMIFWKVPETGFSAFLVFSA